MKCVADGSVGRTYGQEVRREIIELGREKQENIRISNSFDQDDGNLYHIVVLIRLREWLKMKEKSGSSSNRQHAPNMRWNGRNHFKTSWWVTNQMWTFRCATSQDRPTTRSDAHLLKKRRCGIYHSTDSDLIWWCTYPSLRAVHAFATLFDSGSGIKAIWAETVLPNRGMFAPIQVPSIFSLPEINFPLVIIFRSLWAGLFSPCSQLMRQACGDHFKVSHVWAKENQIVDKQSHGKQWPMPLRTYPNLWLRYLRSRPSPSLTKPSGVDCCCVSESVRLCGLSTFYKTGLGTQ